MQVDFNIDTAWCLEQLFLDGMISERDQYLVSTSTRQAEQASWHALQWIAHFQLRDQLTTTVLDLTKLCTWLAKKSHLNLYNIDPLHLDVAALTQIMTQEFAIKNHILALEIRQEEILIGTSQPFNREWCQHLSQSLTNKKIVVVLVDPVQIQRYQQAFYQVSQAVSFSEQKNQHNVGITVEPLLQLGDQADLTADDQHIVKLVDWVLQFAFEQRSSDIHLEPRQANGHIRFRIDGILHTVYRMPAATFTAVIARIKILARLNVAEKRRPQDGRLKMHTATMQDIELRLSTLPTAFGEKLVIRIFDPEVLVRSFQQLGFDAALVDAWQALIRARHGMILVTGPTGSGKTTTLYSTLKHCASPQINVCTIEDPIEMLEPSFNQIQVNSAVNLGFAEGIRALMRQDPDMIMVGEIRDQDTANMAIQAALTGHLVISTLHTNDAPSSLIRLHDLGVQPFLTAATLLGVLAQRLVRRLCPHCKQAGNLDLNKWQYLVRDYVVPPIEKTYQAHGCQHCRHTGFLGRLGVYEFMPIHLALKQQINLAANLDRICATVRQAGVLPLRIAAAYKILQGLTTLEEVYAVVPLDE